MSYKRTHPNRTHLPHSAKRQHVEIKKLFIEDYKIELRPYISVHTNIRDQEDFWSFYQKFKLISGKSGNEERIKVLNIAFLKDWKEMYDRLPFLYSGDQTISIDYSEFKQFLTVIKIYQDFQHKTSFSKLKKIKLAQSDLPIATYKMDIIENIQKHKVLLIAGDTGCGKSTQVPQYILESEFNKIVCTQPRRIACISLAKRVSHETFTKFKNTVGYQIRFEKTKRRTTNITFMTEGLLLRQAADMETIGSYDVFILDEVHERHLYGDFLIGVMKCLLKKNADFRLIIMSATMNMKLFQDYFVNEDLYVIQVPGRLYPIDIQYHPIVKDPFDRKTTKFDSRPYLKIIQMIDNKYPPKQKGDMLIFLNGYSEISQLCDALTEYGQIKQNWFILPLHSSLSLEDQDKVFDTPPDGVRKCIVSTNIAETSITIDGIRFVIDSGKVNRMTYTNTGINKLTECNISQDSARQRSGRAGRTGPGICYRMYSEEDFNSFDPFTPAEIHLVPLDSLILQMASLGLSDISSFPFLEQPSMKSLLESIEKLKFVEAIDMNNECLELTPLGDVLSQLPVDIHIGKMLILSTIFNNLNIILIIASLLSVQSPLTQNAYRNIDADDLRKPMESNHGDPLTLFNFYREWLSKKQSTNVSKDHSKDIESSKVWARKRCLEEQRFYEVTKLTQQFKNILQDTNLVCEIFKKEMTAGERAIRHGELKILKTLQHQLKNEEKFQKRKVLKYRSHPFENQEEDSSKTDIKDVEFRISNDFSRVQELLDDMSLSSYEDIMIIKLILTSSFYPQIAVEDEFNSSKTVSEKLYHTKTKNFVFLKPLSYFASNPDVLELHADDIEEPPLGYFNRKPISKKHQILIYQSILETKKVYLVNTMRMPAIQTMILFAKTIATNSTLTKFVFDNFLLVHVPAFGQGKSLLKQSISLRTTWNILLEKKLSNDELKEENIFSFKKNLIRFVNTEISYNIKRLLPADLKTIFSYDSFNLQEIQSKIRNPFDEKFAMRSNKIGGINVTEYCIYDCLVPEEWDSLIENQILEIPLECPKCQNIYLGSSMLKIFHHEEFCSITVKTEEQPTAIDGNTKRNSKLFHCDICNSDLYLTPTEILKHKKSCK